MDVRTLLLSIQLLLSGEQFANNNWQIIALKKPTSTYILSIKQK